MYSVFGRAVTKNPDGTVTVKAEFVDDRTGQSIRIQDYTGATLIAVRTAIGTDLAALVAAQTDIALSTAVIGKLLGSV